MKYDDPYADFVLHPRYGRRPLITGLDPLPDPGRVFFHWHSPEGARIPNTAVAADISRQVPATIPVTHYFDSRRICRTCRRSFIFFALEQKHWYEELGFGLDSDCVNCPLCRKKLQRIAIMKKRYDELSGETGRSAEHDQEMADLCLTLVEEGIFSPRQLERVSMLLNRTPENLCTGEAFSSLSARLADEMKKGGKAG